MSNSDKDLGLCSELIGIFNFPKFLERLE